MNFVQVGDQEYFRTGTHLRNVGHSLDFVYNQRRYGLRNAIDVHEAMDALL